MSPILTTARRSRGGRSAGRFLLPYDPFRQQSCGLRLCAEIARLASRELASPAEDHAPPAIRRAIMAPAMPSERSPRRPQPREHTDARALPTLLEEGVIR